MRQEIREKIVANIKHFDLCALIKLLRYHGFSREEIYFLSNPVAVSYSSLCQDIHFQDESPRVTIVLNMGLLGSSSLLPSFFHQMMDQEEINSEQFERFLNFFNHHLLDKFIQMTMPELNEDFFVNWKQTQLHYLSLLGFESISTLWFLMKICFPDLIVDVKKNPQTLKLHASSLVLGRDKLGPTAYLGTRFSQTLSSFKITFFTDNEISELGTPWPTEINRRLVELIFPLLKKTDLHLSIVLSIKNKANYLTLGSHSYLGFDRMWKSSEPFNLLIFYGLIKDLQRNRYLSNSY